MNENEKKNIKNFVINSNEHKYFVSFHKLIFISAFFPRFSLICEF